LFWKLAALPAISAICVLANLGDALVVFSDNNSRLVRIRDVQFPTLVSAARNVAALD
jgi:hypothetical protein